MSLQKTPSGLKIRDTLEGTGRVAQRGELVSIHFRCFLNKGEICGSSYDEGKPYKFVLGKRQAIAGFEYGVEGMKVGGMRELVISPHLAYRDKPVGSIPANSVLRFEVELIEVRECQAGD